MNSSEETRLRDELRRIVPAGAPAPDLDAVERRGRREQRRAVALRGLGAVGVAGIAVAGSLVAFRHPAAPAAGPVTVAPAIATPGKTASGQPPRTPAPPLDNVAYVRQQVGAARDPANSVVEMKQSGIDADNPPQTVWTDPATINKMMSWASGGSKVTTWEHQYLDRHRVINLDYTQVNYGPRTWSDRTENFGTPVSGPAPTTPVLGISYIPAASAKLMLTQGNVKIVGHPVVDGHRTVELSVSLPAPEKNYFYVDAQTFQLVRLVRVFAPGSAHQASATSDYSWVRRTPALTRLINHPQIPAGFTQVPADS
ncbi:MAG TPA: hypothetical protein VGD91_04710 [Trebonia sp.]